MIWGSAGAVTGASYTLRGTAALFLASLPGPSAFFAGNLEERVEDDSFARLASRGNFLAIVPKIVLGLFGDWSNPK
jgi:hypothetical protein